MTEHRGRHRWIYYRDSPASRLYRYCARPGCLRLEAVDPYRQPWWRRLTRRATRAT